MSIESVMTALADEHISTANLAIELRTLPPDVFSKFYQFVRCVGTGDTEGERLLWQDVLRDRKQIPANLMKYPEVKQLLQESEKAT